MQTIEIYFLCAFANEKVLKTFGIRKKNTLGKVTHVCYIRIAILKHKDSQEFAFEIAKKVGIYYERFDGSNDCFFRGFFINV